MKNELATNEAARLEQLETEIRSSRDPFFLHTLKIGNALREIRDSKLYRQTHKTFAEYCETVWGFSRPRAYQLIESAEVIEELSTVVDKSGDPDAESSPLSTVVDKTAVTDRQVRELAKAPSGTRAAVLQDAADAAPKDRKTGKPKLTAARVRAAVAKSAELKDSPEPAEKPCPKDEYGTPLPDRKNIREAFETYSTFTDLMNRISAIKAEIKRLPEESKFYFTGANGQQLETHLSNARGSIEFARPHAVCPYCKGKENSTCSACKGHGWVNKDRYKSAPSEMKAGAA